MAYSGTVEPTRSAAPAPERATSAAAGWKPQMSFTRSFSVAHPADQVWTFFAKVEDVASCLPGTSLTGPPVNGHVEGQIRIRVGPIVADFHGLAEIERDEPTRTGRIAGSGKDRRSGSTTRGLVTYAVKPDPKSRETQVDVSIGYTLTGMLAQFGRSGLVEDVASRLIAAFVTNLEARLGHDTKAGRGTAPTPVAELNAGSMMMSVLAARLRGALSRLFTRR
jgi:carbon-monoxide dehydrogenase small subunit